ncbi:hypothetical protein GCM10023224_17580 [Streptomonospora halophila]|uniref:Uncharacterized protein n=1 Tax=Streptomonospora halophila TaxID=427369 RepID=A0ABP9GC72_9ACTN
MGESVRRHEDGPGTIAWCAIAAIPGPLNPGALLSGLSEAAWAVIEPRTPAHDRTKGGAADAIRRPARPFPPSTVYPIYSNGGTVRPAL